MPENNRKRVGSTVGTNHAPEMSEAVARRVCRLSTTAMHTETHHDIEGLQLFVAQTNLPIV